MKLFYMFAICIQCFEVELFDLIQSEPKYCEINRVIYFIFTFYLLVSLP